MDSNEDLMDSNHHEKQAMMSRERRDDELAIKKVRCPSLPHLLHIPFNWYIRYLAAIYKLNGGDSVFATSLCFPNPKTLDGALNMEFTCKNPPSESFDLRFCIMDKMVVDVELMYAFHIRRSTQRHYFLLNCTDQPTRDMVVQCLSVHCPVIDWEPLRTETRQDVPRLDVAVAAFRRVLSTVLPCIQRGGVRDDAARKIQREWRKAVSDPGHLVCRKRLMWEFENL